jgi:hypothetical protein
MGLTLSPKQKAAWRMLADPSKSRVVLDGGGRSGKTAVIVEWMVDLALCFPGSWHAVLRKHRAHCKQALWNGSFTKYLDEHIKGTSRKYILNKDELSIVFDNGSRIMFDGCDDEARVRNLYGNEYMTMWFNEASEFQWAVVDQLFSRCVQRCVSDPKLLIGGGQVGQCKVVLDTNPKGARHWLFRAGVQNVDPDTSERFPDAARWGRIGGWSPYDNRQNLSPDAIATYEAMTGVTRRRMLDGEWCSQEGLIYSTFDEEVHVCKRCEYKDAPARCPRMWTDDGKKWRGNLAYRSIDFGFRDPFTCGWWGYIDGTLLMYRERYVRGKIVADHAAQIKKASEGERIAITYADHDAEDSETLRREGIPTRRAKKDRPISAGIDRVMKRLKADDRGCVGLEICQYARATLSEIGSYIWDAQKEQPMAGQDDHSMDQLRYMVAGIDGVQRSSVFFT